MMDGNLKIATTVMLKRPLVIRKADRGSVRTCME